MGVVTHHTKQAISTVLVKIPTHIENIFSGILRFIFVRPMTVATNIMDECGLSNQKHAWPSKVLLLPKKTKGNAEFQLFISCCLTSCTAPIIYKIKRLYQRLIYSHLQLQPIVHSFYML